MIALQLQCCVLFYIVCVSASFASSSKELEFHSLQESDIILLSRSRRDVGPAIAMSPTANTSDTTTSENPSDAAFQNKTTSDIPKNSEVTGNLQPKIVPKTPLLGQNGTGIRKNYTGNASPDAASPTAATNVVTVNLPLKTVQEVSTLGRNKSAMSKMDPGNTSPIAATNIAVNNSGLEENPFPKSQSDLLAENNITTTKNDTHTYYNSTFYKDPIYFSHYWTEISKEEMQVNTILSNSHRRAMMVNLMFDFPFYGEVMRNVTIATGGFMYVGSYVHSWLAATQYIAPLMANFDTRLFNESYVKHIDNGTALTVLWENVCLQERNSEVERFTFAATLHQNGDIVFAYKTIPIPIQSIEDSEHPVKVGLSDAYIIDKLIYFARRKTIFEYHRVDFRNQSITSGTVLKLTPLPTCLDYKSCAECIKHQTNFNCSWCSVLDRCSNGNDRSKHDWSLRQCDEIAIRAVDKCPAIPQTTSAPKNQNQSTAYVISKTGDIPHDVVIKHDISSQQMYIQNLAGNAHAEKEGGSSIAGALVSVVSVIAVAAALAWVLYAYRNPHTRSGQMLITYRPSNWGWRRGEARYTAATIHM